ncbi:Cellulase (glycosyl hydrolase family 5) [Phytophthora infestans]|uniref:Cellulase (Glycosyl hydrolase family 5) n=1 Tax=Phytophthora infestans TaxID=4787 RepID=A0A8S9TM39_PHYIN|nr:Cellulase (glycosyl hydrolase family 5) [Phytophthora infestans]
MRRELEREYGMESSASLITSSEMLGSPTYNYSAMLSREDSSDIPEHDYIPQQSAREVFREPSDAQTYGAVSGYGTHDNNRFSTMNAGSPRHSSSGSGNGIAPVTASGSVFTRGSLMDRNIAAVSEPATGFIEKTQQYKGRYRTWPGILLLILIVGGAVVGITLSALHASDSATTRQEEYAQRKADGEKISGGASGSGSDLVSDDGEVGNPKLYPEMGCELPDYQSKNGRIVAVSANGTEVPVDIKGINWFGMETGTAIPLGLWDNADNGTTAYQIASFLADNKFNAVRLPLCVNWILTNPVPETTLINTAENRAISVKNYMSLLKSIVKVLENRGSLWYSDEISQNDFLDAIDTLTTNLCSESYWNIMGIDVKNEPSKATWGDGSDTDFHAGAKEIADRMLDGCSNWMGFVEGINADHTVTIDDTKYDYYDWYGGGLQDAADYPLTFSTDNKVVYAPHYYTPAVYPQSYFYDGGTQGANGAISDYVEVDNATLKSRIKATMADMFGFLANDNSSALLLGEFGGLYSKDLHPELTAQRCTDLSMEVIVESGWAGGFVWSLNPESAYQYNPADTYGTFTEGILEDDWLTANSDFLKGMTTFNDLANLRSMPCFEVEESSSGSDSSI